MLNLYYSNKLEALAAQLGANLATDPLPVLVAETIIVESAAMSQWLTKQLTCQLGIAANLKFPFPAALVWQTYRQLMADLPRESSFDRGVLIWRLYNFFISDDVRQLPDLEKYISRLDGNKHILFFAEHLAGLYDQYQIYRPDWLNDWQKGKLTQVGSYPWQAELWQLLCLKETCGDNPNDISRAEVFVKAMHLLNALDKPVKGVQRLQVFAVATLPQPYIELFAALSKTIEINIYVLNPCALFWSNLQPEKVRIKQAQAEMDFREQVSSEQRLVQNELLALMAKQGREYIELLQQQPVYEEHDCYVKVSEDNLLAYLQNDILTLRQASLHEEKIPLADDDQSIQFHSCHSALREVQVLHNQLLKILDDNPLIELDDIVIMVPELESYAPYFHAVFATADERMQLPYHLAERKNFEDQPIKRSLVQLLKIPLLHYRRAEISSLLQEIAIARQFGITDLTLVDRLLEELQVRFLLKDQDWFNMGDHMVSFAWQQAKERLLLSYASAEVIPDIESFTVEGIYDNTADEAGRLCEFIDRLEFLEYQNQKRTLSQWCEYVEQVLQRFFRLEEDTQLLEAQSIRSSLEKVQQNAQLAAYAEEIEFELFLHVFEADLQQASQHHFFKQDAVNIATLLPMRSLPFKVVCMLGMNDGEFPRPVNTDRIDLMMECPRKGDRNRREEDRYLFLEALLSARHTCYISYIGRSYIDNSERYPSLLVTELIEHLNDCYQYPEGQTIAKRLITHHKLQPFDPDYFNAESTFISYSSHQLKQAEKLLQPKISTIYSVKPLELEESRQVDLYSLADALVEPSRFFLQQLQVTPKLETLEDESVESFQVDALDQYLLLDLLFSRLINGQSLPEAEYLCRHGLLPQAVTGEIDYDSIKAEVLALYEQVKSHHLDVGDLQIEVTACLNGIELSGEITRCNDSKTQRIAALCTRLHGKHLIKAWVSHVFASYCMETPIKSYILTLDKCYRLNAIEKSEAKKLLQQLLVCHEDHRVDLSWFFPKSAWAYVSLLAKDESKAERELIKQLYNNPRGSVEWYSPYNAYAYRGKDIDLERVMSRAQLLFNPVLDYLDELAVEEVN